MTVRTAPSSNGRHRALLMIGASLATLASGLAVQPAHAQSTLSGIMGGRANAPRPPVQGPAISPARPMTMNQALSRQRATSSRTEQIRAYVLSARDAAIAANRGPVTDGLSANGLDPTGTIAEAVAAARAGDTVRANELLVSASANLDATGLKTWEGAGLPTQTTADGKTVVTIDQTKERALLSWNRFNVGANTTLQFNQKSNGVAQPGWVVANRVTNSVAPSQILGTVKADGTVVVINQSGIIFGAKSQVNTRSLLASTLDLNNGTILVPGVGQRPASVKNRNDFYLQNGLFGTSTTLQGGTLLVSAPAVQNEFGIRFSDQLEGGIVVDHGANITAGAGGFLILAAPLIDMSGQLRAVDGQVSLQAGRGVAFTESTGASTSADPFVRGYKLNSFDYGFPPDPAPRAPVPGDGRIIIRGLVESRRGYLSLGTGAFGSIEQNGLLSVTTSVSRNGKISLTSGNISLGGSGNAAQAGGIEMLADASGETLPQGSASEPASFKASQLEIGTQVQFPAQLVGNLLPTNFAMGQNAIIYAPGANVSVGVTTSGTVFPQGFVDTFAGRVDIADGAVIDVSGLKDVQLSASRNQIQITPVKRNELRDTPNYREVALDGNFSLNGATLFVDPRLSGVRADGVAWIGSPLIEAGSLASQISITAQEFMTRGGTVSLLTGRPGDLTGITVDNAPSVTIARGASIDFSGGWVNYAAGPVRTSRLITNDGRVVDIGNANPNDVYVGVADGFTEIQPRFGILSTAFNGALTSQRFEGAYDEGRDAGRLTIGGVAVTNDGTLHGNAFAGTRQIASGGKPGATPAAGDPRSLQRSPYELPSGGGLSISTLGDILVYRGVRGPAESNAAELLLDDAMLSGAGLSALSLSAAGQVTFAGATPATLQAADALTITGASDLRLTPSGALSVTAGRTIRFDGTVTANSGSITAITQISGSTIGLSEINGSVFRTGSYSEGGDDLFQLYGSDPGAINPLDIVVTGTLSTAGLWINDFTETGQRRGGQFSDGGSISLTVAPNVFAAIGDDFATATKAVDLSGSIRITGALNAASGGYVTPTGELVLDGKGGNVSLINRTVYASTRLTDDGLLSSGASGADDPLFGENQSVDFTPVPGTIFSDVLPRLVADPRSTVDLTGATIQGFGFGGGGTFTLAAPDVSFGSDNRAGAAHIGLDFFRATGFGTLDVSTFRSRIVGDVFTNDRAGNSAFLETTRFVVGAGETFDLTQWVLPSIVTADQVRSLRGLGSGADLLAQAYLSPVKPESVWDQQAANVALRGLTELNVLAGGQIIGAPEASLTVGKLYNAGKIVLQGGTISQGNDLPNSLLAGGLGVRDTGLGGNGLQDAFGGPVDLSGRFDEEALNAAGVANPEDGALLTNRQLVSLTGADRLIYFLGVLDASEGILLADGSVTDLSGVALIDPRTPRKPDGERIRAGRVLDGGSLLTQSGRIFNRTLRDGSRVPVSSAQTLIRRDGAALDISGASAVFDQATGTGGFAPYLEWSKAGTISALGGGSLGTTAINARGGVAAAQGGTLEWLRPTIGDDARGGADYLLAGMIADSGFDSFIARNTLTLDGDFSLGLRKSFMLLSQNPTGGSLLDPDAAIYVNATEGTSATIGAGYIRFASRLGTTQFATSQDSDAAVTFAAGGQGIDLAGGVGFDRSIASVAFRTPGDIRLIGVNDQGVPNVAYNGQLVTFGDLLLDARRTYATTGTGNLQALLEGAPETLARAYDVVALGNRSITFGNSFFDPKAPAPLSAGTHVRVLAERIVQNGYLAAPLGLLELGSSTVRAVAGSTTTPTKSLILGPGSVTTVSGAGLTIPYGTTTDLIEYYFPTLPTPITRLPTGQLNLAADSIVQESGSLFDGRGGGDIFAYEFQSGVGGSRDVLDRFNRDAFSGNDFDPVTGVGYQYPDRRQVFALVPVSQRGEIALFDPVYSADYGSAGPVDLYGANAGLTVRLDGAPGIPAGEYLLVPAKYAMSIPGALRVVQNDTAAPLPGASASLLDGSVIVGGTYAYGGTGIAESTRHSFTVQSKDSFLRYSKIVTTSGSESIAEAAADKGLGRPRLPIDAARVVLAPLSELRVAGAFDTRAGEGGQGGQFDILGSNIVIAATDDDQAAGALTLSSGTLAGLDATSLLIGGRRSDNADGTTAITASASAIDIGGGTVLDAPELLLAVGGDGSMLTIGDGATLTASGTAGTQPASDYRFNTAGSFVRLSSGAERLAARTGDGASTIRIGDAAITGGTLTLDSSGSFAIADAASIDADKVAISGTAIRFDSSAEAAGQAGVIGAALEAKLGAADVLTVRSAGAIRFSSGTHMFNDLILDTATLATTAATGADGSVTIDAGDVRLVNSGNAADGCATAGFCGAGDALTLNADTLTFGANAVRTSGFTGSVTLAAAGGMYVEGKGSFSTGAAALTLRTPFLADRAQAADPRGQKQRPDYTFLTNAGFAIAGPGLGVGTPQPAGNGAPGARIGIGTIDAPVLSAGIAGSLIRATAGIIDIQSRGDIALSGATLSVPGYEQTFGDSVDAVTVSAGGGVVNLTSRSGDLRTDAGTTLITDTGVGLAGKLNLLAGNGAITLNAVLNPGATGQRAGSFAFDSGTSAFDLDAFTARYARLFGGDVAVRSGAGNLSLGAGQTYKAKSFSLTADGGAIVIAGTIDTSGVNVAGMTADQARNAAVDGGDIALWGRSGVTLASTARLDTHTNGYADTDTRAASAGDVTIGIESPDAALTIAAGAIIDVGARRTQLAQGVGESGGRLIPDLVTDPITGLARTVYRYAEPDAGGTVRLRAPVLGAGEDQVAVSLGGAIQGAAGVQLEAFKRFDLDAIADSGAYTGVTRAADGTLVLDFAATGSNPFTENFQLADGGASLVGFIQNFDIGTVDGSSLAGVRVRPGVELAAAGDVRTATQWNLAAANFSPEQLQAAVAAGVLEVIPALSTGGESAYRVIPGREGDLLDQFATFLYRVDGSARGEAAVVTLRAGGDLTINRSINDGFFTFRDKSDPRYISNQLRRVPPVNSPLALSGNGAAAGGEARDSLGFAELFPLLDGDVAMHSSDLRLVAGAGSTLSANPLLVDRARDAAVTLAGEYSYRVTANGAAGAISYGSPTQQNNAATPNRAYVRSFVRTGDGAIEVAAAGDIDLRGAAQPVYRQRDGIQTILPNNNAGAFNASAQFAAAAIYTAGVRVPQADISARIIGGGGVVSLTPDSPYLLPVAEQVDFIPSTKALSDTQPVLAYGGGDISLEAGRDVLGRRDVWSEFFLDAGANYTGGVTGGGVSTTAGLTIGQRNQRWRTGGIGVDTEIGIAPRYFTSGVGALAGGDVTIEAGRDVVDLTVALTNSVTSTPAAAGTTMLTLGSGDLMLTAGRDILAGRYDIASGTALIHADRDIASFGLEPTDDLPIKPQYLRVRLADAVVGISTRGSAMIASISALGVDLPGSVQSTNSAGFFSPTAAFGLTSNERAELAPSTFNGNFWDYGYQPGTGGLSSSGANFHQVLPPSFAMTSLTGSVVLPAAQQLLYPSKFGQLRLLSDSDITSLSIAMSDVDPSLLAGAFVSRPNDNPYQFPFVTANTTDAQLRAQHNRRSTHANNPDPVRIYSNGDIDQSAIFLPKQGRITANGDIVDMFFVGQNLAGGDITRIRAGGDITGTIGPAGERSFVRSNNFILGGPGTFIVEAGGDVGPFVTSATVVSPVNGIAYSFAGGIRTIGNDYNPWLAPEGADLSIRFGMANGADYTALRDTYLNPANLAQLDGDLFEQIEDGFGNQSPDRSKPIYAPLLAQWLRDEAPETFAALFGEQTFPDTEAGNAALAAAAYGRVADLYAAFSGLELLRQQDFLVNDLYFNELAQAGNPDGPSFQQYVRGYRAVQTLFPTRLGYTDNLAPYTLDPSTVSADHPLGEPVRNIVNGQPQRANRIETGNIDLRLATIQTARGGDVSILGPGGDFIAGSVVRTADQAARRATVFFPPDGSNLNPGLEGGSLNNTPRPFLSVPIGFEGILTLRGGQVRSFTDGNFILNQSRLFTQQNGNILMWSSNGDLNAGQGPRSASSFPPVTVRFDEDGLAEVNSAGSVAGAGIGAFQRLPTDPPSDVVLIAPVGEVDAGDAGVRASGNVVVAAARVANADNFSAGGEITGVPSAAVATAPATPRDAASAIAAQAASAANRDTRNSDRRSVITVDVLGPVGGDGQCPDPERTDDPDCPVETPSGEGAQ